MLVDELACCRIFKFKFIQKFKNLAKIESDPQVARANLGGPTYSCLRIKLISLQLLQSNTEQIEFRGGKVITSKINEKQKLTSCN